MLKLYCKLRKEVIPVPAVVFGIEHFIYIGITTAIASTALLLAKKFAKSETAKTVFLKTLAALLLIAIVTNRLSQVFRYGQVRWEQLIPDSYCGMTSLVLSLAVLFGKKDNYALHAVWLLAIFGGIATVAYPTFIGQGPTVFYLPTISGLLHHSLSATLAITVLLFGWIRVTYKKWYCTLFGFACYMTVGAFLVGCLGFSDACHIYTPLLDGTPLTAWVMAVIYAFCYALILFVIEAVRKKRGGKEG